jgi:phospholipid/cholesterol/gamma-HCH transport system substrate-binding protein
MRSHLAAYLLVPCIAVAVTGCSLQPNANVLPGQTATGGDGYTVTVHFGHVENLVRNSAVMYRDATIGTVTDIKLDDWQPTVTLRLLEDVKLPANTRFTIGQKTLLGAQYVEVEASTKASGAALADGAVVPVSRTGGYPETEQVLSAAALLLNNGGLSQISTITGELSAALDHQVDARELIDRLQELLDIVDANKENVIGALRELDGLSGSLAAQRTDIARAIDDVTPALRMLNRERDQLVRSVHAAGVLSGHTVQLVGATQGDLLGTLEALRPTLANLARSSAHLPEALKFMVTLPFPIMTSDQAVKGDFANLFATLDLSGSTLSKNFGSYVLPGLQASNPLATPLLPQVGGLLPQVTDPLLKTLPQVGSLLSPAPKPAPAPSTSAKSCGLLSVLGGC